MSNIGSKKDEQPLIRHSRERGNPAFLAATFSGFPRSRE